MVGSESEGSPPEVASDTHSVSPDQAFALLGNETRIAILRALWEAHEPYEGDSKVPFSELYELVDIKDTGNFNYHLKKLSGHFIRQTDTGYELTNAGFAVVQTVISGTIHKTPALDRAEVDAVCPRCDGRIAVSYDPEKDVIEIQCTQCPGHWHQNWPRGTIFAFDIPPAGLRDRTPDGAFEAMLSWRIYRIQTMVDGVCPICAGDVETSYSLCEEHDLDNNGMCPTCGNYFRTIVTHICTICKEKFRMPLMGEVLFHPAVTAFFYNREIEHRMGDWDAIARAHGYDQTILSKDPLRLQVTISVDEDDLQITLDENLTAIDVNE